MHLEQLIEQCGERFRWLKMKGAKTDRKWLAQGKGLRTQGDHGTQTTPDIDAWGATPTEAVEKLLELLK